MIPSLIAKIYSSISAAISGFAWLIPKAFPYVPQLAFLF
jgi:hypothetical protein